MAYQQQPPYGYPAQPNRYPAPPSYPTSPHHMSSSGPPPPSYPTGGGYPGYPVPSQLSLNPAAAGQYPPHSPAGYGPPAGGPYGSPYPAAPASSPFGGQPLQPPHSPYVGQSPYGPPSPYGAPAAAPYGGAPYGAAAGALGPAFGAFPPTPPSLGYAPPQPIQWDGGPDAQALRRAMKGIGTNENELIRVLADKDPLQVDVIRAAFRTHINRDLVADIKSETGGHFREGLVALARGPLLADVHAVNEAIAGVGTNEALLSEVLLGRSNADMNAIRAVYQQTFNKDMAREVCADLSMKTQRHFDMVMAARRAEDSEPVDPGRVAQDVDALYGATEGKLGTDQLRVAEVLTYRNDGQIRAIAEAYQQRYRRPLSEVIRKEFSGHMQDALLFQLRHGEDRIMHAAELLEASMRGLGTKDKLLVSRVVRFHWNRAEMAMIKQAYQQLMKQQRMSVNLGQRIRGETSSYQCKMLLACIGEPWA